MPDELVNVRYMVDDVDGAVASYTPHFGFALRSSVAPAFADVVRGNPRLLLSGPTSSAGASGRLPEPTRRSIFVPSRRPRVVWWPKQSHPR